MKELPPKGGWKQERDSFSKLIVWFKDGNIRTMYSWDWHNRYKERDREVGLKRFKVLLETRYAGKMRAARIYDKETGEELLRYPNNLENSKPY